MANLAIISDSHNTKTYLELLNFQLDRYGVDTILHLGDVTSSGITQFLDVIKGYKIYFVVGNNDFERERLEKEVEAVEGVVQDQPLCFDWNNRRIFAVHGHANVAVHGHDDGLKLAKNAFDSGEWDLVCYGHTHVYKCKSKATSKTSSGVSYLLNPGALLDGSFCLINDNRFEPQHYDLNDMEF